MARDGEPFRSPFGCLGRWERLEIAEGSGEDDLLTAAGMLQQINLCERRCRADGHWILSRPLPLDGRVGVERSRRGAVGNAGWRWLT